MRAREGVLKSDFFGDQLDLLYPIIEDGGSDSAAFDNVLELLVINGVLSLPEAVMLMIPEAWEGNSAVDGSKLAFYEWAACMMEPGMDQLCLSSQTADIAVPISTETAFDLADTTL